MGYTKKTQMRTSEIRNPRSEINIVVYLQLYKQCNAVGEVGQNQYNKY